MTPGVRFDGSDRSAVMAHPLEQVLGAWPITALQAGTNSYPVTAASVASEAPATRESDLLNRSRRLDRRPPSAPRQRSGHT